MEQLYHSHTIILDFFGFSGGYFSYKSLVAGSRPHMCLLPIGTAGAVWLTFLANSLVLN